MGRIIQVKTSGAKNNLYHRESLRVFLGGIENLMTVQISKFGDFLMSHPAGKDAFLLAESHLFNSLDADEEIILDFADVKVLTPS